MGIARKKGKPEASEVERALFDQHLDDLCSDLSYSFVKKDLLRQALTHSSFSQEPQGNYERLEFLGDRVLELVVSRWLYEANRAEREGNLTKRLAWLVDEEHLNEVGRRLKLDRFVRIGTALRRDRLSDGVIADLVEALVGAIYLDRGVASATKFIRDHIWDKEVLGEEPLNASPRNTLQELCDRAKVAHPRYECTPEGPDHSRSFLCKASVRIEDKAYEATGEGASEITAVRAAAKRLLEMIGGRS